MVEITRKAAPQIEMIQGKSKDVYFISNKELEFRFTDRLTVFDVRRPNYIPYKGAVLAQTAEYMFDVARYLDIATHFIKMTGPNCMRVRRMEVIPNPTEIDRPNTFINLEFIVRNYVEGSLWRAVQEGKIGSFELHFPPRYKIKRGDKLMAPRFEMWTKFEPVDRLLGHEEAMKIGGISERTVERIKGLILRLNDGIQERVTRYSIKQIGSEYSSLTYVDGKKEVALDEKGNPIFVDSFWTPDEDRFWEGSDYNNGRLVDKSKEFVRQYYIDIGYHGELMAVRERNKEFEGSGKKLLPEPEIPLLPRSMVKQTGELYIEMFERLSGRRFMNEPYNELMLERRD